MGSCGYIFQLSIYSTERTWSIFRMSVKYRQVYIEIESYLTNKHFLFLTKAFLIHAAETDADNADKASHIDTASRAFL